MNNKQYKELEKKLYEILPDQPKQEIDNWLIEFTHKFVKAKRMRIDYKGE
jgi:endonuclease III